MENKNHNEPSPDIKRLERKVNILIMLTIGLSVLVCLLILALMVESLLPSTPTLVLLVLLMAAVAYLFRKQVPGWFGSLSRMFFAHMLSAKSDSVND